MIRDEVERALHTLNTFNSRASTSAFSLDVEHGAEERLVRIDWRGATAAVTLGKIAHLRIRFDFPNGQYFEGDTSMAFNLADNGVAVATLSPVDARGFAAQVESVVWTSSDESVITVTAHTGDPMKADVAAVGAPGSTAQVQVSADADLGAGVVTLTGVADVALVPGQAVTLSIGLASA